MAGCHRSPGWRHPWNAGVAGNRAVRPSISGIAIVVSGRVAQNFFFPPCRHRFEITATTDTAACEPWLNCSAATKLTGTDLILNKVTRNWQEARHEIAEFVLLASGKAPNRMLNCVGKR